MKKTQNDEIDLFLFFKTLYDGKWVIIAFVILGLLLGFGFYLSKNPVYESKLKFSIDTIPPFYEEKEVLVNFQKIFYSGNIFRDWKKVNTNTILKFQDFSKIEILNGTIIQTDAAKITFEIKKKNNFFLRISSNELKFLDDVYNYTLYVNNFLKLNYKLESNSALSIIKKNISLISKLGKSNLDYLSIKLFLMKSEKGAQPFDINRPTMPKKISPKNLFPILNFSFMLSVIIGCLFIVIRKVTLNHKKKMT